MDPLDEGPRREWEEALPTITARAWSFGMPLAATQVLPRRFAAATAAAARTHLFADLDAALAARLGPGDVLVAEEHAGDDDAAAPALAALQAAGVRALIGRRAAPAVERAALAHGVLVLVVDAPASVRTGDRLRIDLDAAKIANLSSGDRAPIRNLGEAYRAAIRDLLERHPIASHGP